MALADRGWTVEFHARPGDRPGPRVRAWVINTDSRHDAPARAAAKVRSAVRSLRRWGAVRLYKKIDSTLRGPLGAETDAFLRAGKFAGPLFFIPAFPGAGRTLVGGRLLVNGVPLNRTPFGRDPRSPRRTARVAALLRRPRGLDRRLTIPEVPDNAALRRAARRAAEDPAALGSSAFLGVYAGRGTGRAALPAVPRARSGAVVAGSAHPRTAEQLRYLESRLRRGNFPARWNVHIIQAPRRRAAAETVLRSLLASARGLSKARPSPRWVLTGGETALRLVKYWGQNRWRIIGKIAPGVPLCRSEAGATREMVLKPGGFGSTDVLWKSLNGATA